MRNNRIWIVLVLLAIIVLAAACGTREASEETTRGATLAPELAVVSPTPAPPTAMPEPPKPPTATPEPAATMQPTRAATPTSVPRTPKPTATPSLKGLFERPDETLDSYRSRSTTTLMNADEAAGTGIAALLFGNRVIETEFVREPKAMHVTMTMSDPEGTGQIETIIIGDESWIRFGDNWMKAPSQGQESEANTGQDIGSELEQLLEDMESGMAPLGKDEINGRRCQRYSVDSKFVLPLPTPDAELPANFMPTEMAGTVTGEICVADERNFPAVPLRQQLAYEITMKYASGDEEQVAFEELSELYDINESISIQPPENAIEMPVAPGTP